MVFDFNTLIEQPPPEGGKATISSIVSGDNTPSPSGNPAPMDWDKADILRYDGSKFRRMATIELMEMVVNELIFAPIVVRFNGTFFCGSDETWKAAADKGDARKPLHDLFIELYWEKLKKFSEPGNAKWLHMKAKNILL